MDLLLDPSIPVFIGLTVVLAGGAGILTGRAIAESWRPAAQVLFASFGLALADRFLVYALFEGDLLNLPGFLFHYAVIAALALVAWRIRRTTRLCRQYPWRYERTSLFSYAERSPS